MSRTNRRAVRWLTGELPALVASGAISQEQAVAIERHFARDAAPERNVAFTVIAIVGSILIAAGVVLLVAHNWDELNRPVRCTIALLPLVAAQMLCVFVLRRRYDSKPWRESAAIFNVAAIGTAIALVSQTYQIHGSLANFILTWLLLSLPLIYLLRTTLGAVAYLVGTAVWATSQWDWSFRIVNPLPFWLLLLLAIPYAVLAYRRDTRGAVTTLFLAFVIAAAVGLGVTAEYTHANLGLIAFAGLFTLTYLGGMELFRENGEDHVPLLALLGGVAVGVMAIVITFRDSWNFHSDRIETGHAGLALGIVIEILFPLMAIGLAAFHYIKRRTGLTHLIAAFPLIAVLGSAIAWSCAKPEYGTSYDCQSVVALLLNLYTLALGIELLMRGLRASSITRANFALAIIGALAAVRFFDSDLSFIVRGAGFIIIGIAFLFTNFVLFKRRNAA
ncbi:MAG: DUF2157 domain-containing protein [Chthoniobacterales bacterium]